MRDFNFFFTTDSLSFYISFTGPTIYYGEVRWSFRSTLFKEEGEKTMKAAVVREFTSPLRLEEIAKPEPEPGKIVVKIEALFFNDTAIPEIYTLSLVDAQHRL